MHNQKGRDLRKGILGCGYRLHRDEQEVTFMHLCPTLLTSRAKVMSNGVPNPNNKNRPDRLGDLN